MSNALAPRRRFLARRIMLALPLCVGLAALFTGAARGQTESSARGMLLRAGGQSEMAELRGVDAAGRLVFGGAAPRESPAADMWRFGADPARLRGPYLLLRDGSRYAAPALRTDANEIELPADAFQPALWDGRRFPRSQVQAILWKPPHGAAALAALLELQKPVESDALRLDNGDLVSGEFRGIAEGDGGEEELRFLVRQRESRIPVARVVSLQFASKEALRDDAAAPAWTLAFADGSRIRAHDLAASQEEVRWRSPSGEVQTLDPARFWKNLLLLEPPRRQVRFLSDLTPQGYRHLPLFGEPAAWGRDRSAAGAPLRHRGAWFAKGIGMWSNSRLTFDIPEGATRFQAQICLDDAAGASGSVRFRLLSQARGAEGGPLKDLYRSEVLRGGDAPAAIDLAIDQAAAGDALLILLVESADREDVLDLANWLDARFVIGEK